MLSGARVLVVEDDEAINTVVCSFLTKQGARCTAAFSGTEGLLHLRSGDPFDLLITDLMLPGAPGEEVVAAAACAGLPSMVLSARAAVADRVSLLRIGADDYLVKPFDLEELQARCEALLRRGARVADSAAAGVSGEDVLPEEGSARLGTSEDDTADVLRYGAWELDRAARALTAAGVPVRLTRTEYEMVRTLMENPRRVLTKRALSEAAGGSEAALEDKTVSTHIGNVRAKVREAGAPDYIETVWGVGFKLRDEGE